MAPDKSEKWFGGETPACSLCEYGRWDGSHTAVLCKEKGVMQPDGHCRRFRYDPFRREPRRRPSLPEYDPKDFEI